MVQLYLRMDRLDLAQAQLKSMKAADEDSTLSMLATAWVNLTIVRTPPIPPLLMSIVVCVMLCIILCYFVLDTLQVV